MIAPDLQRAAAAIDAARGVLDKAAARLAGLGDLDANQVLAYDLAHAAAARRDVRHAARLRVQGRHRGPHRLRLRRRRRRRAGRQALRPRGGVGRRARRPRRRPRVRRPRTARRSSSPSRSTATGPRHLDGDFEMVRDTFRRFAEDKIRPVAEHVHRTNADIPEDVISRPGRDRRVRPVGARGVRRLRRRRRARLPRHGRRHRGAVRGSLGVGGSLITRPEILTRAVVKGGTEEQKQHWLPRLATGEVMAAWWSPSPTTAPTSPASRSPRPATPDDGGWRINGVKTWCTFGARADVLMLLARTDPDRSLGHRGLSLFIVAQAPGEGHGFAFQDGTGGGKMEGRAIDTIGYRGMHSYEVAFDDWFVPAENLDRRRRRARPGLLPPDGGLRERPAADRGPRRRRHAGRLRGGPPVRRTTGSCSASPSSTTS